MNWKYLAFIALLAGWIWFCYRLYAGRIFPHISRADEPAGLVRMENLDLPLAFSWGSDTPLAGRGFEAWQQEARRIDSTDAVAVWRGYYFRDEAAEERGQVELGQRRVENVLKYMKLDRDRILVEILPQELNVDARSKPFPAVAFEIIPGGEVIHASGDTVQLCFPVPDSIVLPRYSLSQFDVWCKAGSGLKSDMVHVVGTADGTGVAESSDVAIDRADYIRQRLVARGWKEEMIQISAGQRNNPHTLLNRCVLVYFEHVVK